MRILLSRTDSIGDVILTLPMAGILKEAYPDCEIVFIGRSYTRDVVQLSTHVDAFINWDDFASQNRHRQKEALKAVGADWIIHVFPNKHIARAARSAGIPFRVGTSHRAYHWRTCNRPVHFSRRKSELHEAQLNCKLLAPLHVSVPSRDALAGYYGFRVDPQVQDSIRGLLDPHRKKVVLHPKSKGSAREWGLDNFARLARLLPPSDYQVFVSGTADEGTLMRDFLDSNREYLTDLTGKLTLKEFIAFLSLTDAIVAASTGPLHIAASLGRTAIGIYPPIRPMHPGRWSPIGGRVRVLCKPIECEACRNTMHCSCMQQIRPEDVLDAIGQ